MALRHLSQHLQRSDPGAIMSAPAFLLKELGRQRTTGQATSLCTACDSWLRFLAAGFGLAQTCPCGHLGSEPAGERSPYALAVEPCGKRTADRTTSLSGFQINQSIFEKTIELQEGLPLPTQLPAQAPTATGNHGSQVWVPGSSWESSLQPAPTVPSGKQ